MKISKSHDNEIKKEDYIIKLYQARLHQAGELTVHTKTTPFLPHSHLSRRDAESGDSYSNHIIVNSENEDEYYSFHKKGLL